MASLLAFPPWYVYITLMPYAKQLYRLSGARSMWQKSSTASATVRNHNEMSRTAQNEFEVELEDDLSRVLNGTLSENNCTISA